MKVHIRETLKRNIQFVLFVAMALLCAGAIFVNFVVLSKIDRPTLIAIDPNGTRIVTASTDPIYKTEATAFIRKFLFNVYNFESSNFMRRVGLATSLMSERLWKEKSSELMSLKEKVTREQFEIVGNLEKLSVDELGNYHALVRVHAKSRLKEEEHHVKVLIKLSRIERNHDNPFGMEVDEYEETLLRN